MRTTMLRSHPAIERSHTNRRLREAVRDLTDVELCPVDASFAVARSMSRPRMNGSPVRIDWPSALRATFAARYRTTRGA